MYSQLKERDIETLIDNELRNLNWIDNPNSISKSNVFKQKAKTKLQENALDGKRPDYVLYPDNSDEPLAIIEVKKPFEDINKAQKQAKGYAERINAPIVFATDGTYTKTFHMKKQKPLYLNGEEVDELLDKATLLNYLQDNIYNTQDKKVVESREELISIFKNINNDLRNAGVSSGLPRIHLFSNFLFLKVISELAEIGDNLVTLPPNYCLWNNFKNKKGQELLDFLNGQAFDYFKKSYGGEVLSKIDILQGKENILNTIIDRLDDLWLSDTNVDIKGDAFEFFLRNYGGAETDFGEYFTPRHIVKTMVKLLNPQFGEKVYDGFCGTGGMLIECFKHIKRKMPINANTEDIIKRKTIYGGEFSEMYRIAKMNMILAGDGHSNIKRQDSYEKKQTNQYDVVITNIPFGSKMKTSFLPQYGYNGTSAEVCGVLHCLDALDTSNSNARAGIIVPEGILFNSSKAYTNLRRDLTEKHDIDNIISLPQGVFTDAGVKSDILVVKKKPNRFKNHIWYFDLKNDGYTLDKARRKIEGNSDIDTLLSETTLKEKEVEKLEKLNFRILYKDDVRENSYVFLSKTYEKVKDKEGTVLLSQLIKDGILYVKKGQTITKSTVSKGNIPVIAGGKSSPYSHNKSNYNGNIITMSASGAYSGYLWYHNKPIWASDCSVLFSNNEDRLLTKYLYYCLKSKQDYIYTLQHGAGQPHIYIKDIENIQIPFPNLKKQQEIVDELTYYSDFIENTKRLINSWQPILNLKIEKTKKINDICDVVRGGSPRPIEKYITSDEDGLNWIKIGDVKQTAKYVKKTKKKIKRDGLPKTRFLKKGSFILSNSMSFGRPYILKIDGCIHDGWLALQNIDESIDKDFLYYLLLSNFVQNQLKQKARGSTVKNLNKEMVSSVVIPDISLKKQKQIVKDFERQREIIEQNKAFVDMYEDKIKQVLKSLWEEDRETLS